MVIRESPNDKSLYSISSFSCSSAFMSLAARFPSFIVNEPEVCIPDPEDSIQWKQDCDQSSVHNEEKAVVSSSNESPGGSRGTETGCYTATKDSVSSQNSAFLSGNSSFIQTAEKIGSCLKRNLELDGSKPDSASIVELPQMAGSTMLNAVYSHGSSKAPSDEKSKGAGIRSKGMNHDNQRQYPDRLKDPQSSLAASTSPSSDYHLHLTPTSRVLEVEHSEMFREEIQIQYPDSSKMNAATVKAKNKRVQKEKKDEISWDNLRKQVETNGKKRERAANTMDSADWEAVRSAEVNEIADSIKERGMHQKLAEFIKV